MLKRDFLAGIPKAPGKNHPDQRSSKNRTLTWSGRWQISDGTTERVMPFACSLPTTPRFARTLNARGNVNALTGGRA